MPCILAALLTLAALPSFSAAAPASAEGDAAQASSSASVESLDPELQAKVDEAQAQIDELNAAYFEAQGTYEAIVTEIARAQTDVSSLEASIAQAEQELTEAQDALARHISEDYQSGPIGMVDVLLGSSDFDDLITRIYYAGKVNDAYVDLIAQIKDLKASLEEDRATLEQRKSRLYELQAQQKQALSNLETQLAAARQYKSTLDKKVQAELDAQQAEAEKEARALNSRSVVINTALSYLGCPYVWAAEGPNSFDCSGLTMVAYAAAGVSLYHQSGVQYQTVCDAGNLVGAEELEPGDLVFFGYFGSSEVCHVGIYLGDGMIVHALPTSGVAVEELASVSSYLQFLGGGSPV